MELTILNSGSKANGYILHNEHEALLIECGCPVREALKAVGYAAAKIVGCLVTHEHGDHARHMEEYLEYMPVYCSAGTADSITYKRARRPKTLRCFDIVTLGGFTVQPFDTRHDSAEPFGFVITHPESGRIYFATDTSCLKYKMEGANQIMIECNYDTEILAGNVRSRTVSLARMRRITQSHMALTTCLKTLKANNLRQVNNIILLHLSGDNGDSGKFHAEVERATGRKVTVAAKNMTVKFNKTL